MKQNGGKSERVERIIGNEWNEMRHFKRYCRAVLKQGGTNNEEKNLLFGSSSNFYDYDGHCLSCDTSLH